MLFPIFYYKMFFLVILNSVADRDLFGARLLVASTTALNDRSDMPFLFPPRARSLSPVSPLQLRSVMQAVELRLVEKRIAWILVLGLLKFQRTRSERFRFCKSTDRGGPNGRAGRGRGHPARVVRTGAAIQCGDTVAELTGSMRPTAGAGVPARPRVGLTAPRAARLDDSIPPTPRLFTLGSLFTAGERGSLTSSPSAAASKFEVSNEPRRIP